MRSATPEKSTAVTRQPCPASQTAFRPAPHARSSAVPGRRSATSATRNRLGAVLAWTRSSPAQRRFQRSRDGSEVLVSRTS
jgi:hypothetical protein